MTTIDGAGQRYTARIEGVKKENGYYKNLADHLLAGAKLIIAPEWARATIQCIEGCELAAREDRLVEVEFDF